MFFSAKILRQDPLRLEEKLKRDLYRYPALPPSNERIVQIVPQIPAKTLISENEKSISLSWEKGKNTKKFIIYKLRKGKPAEMNSPENIYQVTSETTLSIPKTSHTDLKRYYFVISSQSQTNTESGPEYFYLH